jgi:hypothetical protein
MKPLVFEWLSGVGLEVVQSVSNMAVCQSSKERRYLKANSSVSVYDVNSLRRVKVFRYSGQLSSYSSSSSRLRPAV